MASAAYARLEARYARSGDVHNACQVLVSQLEGVPGEWPLLAVAA
jgi:hypothetical protein